MKKSLRLLLGCIAGALLLIGGILYTEVDHVRTTIASGKPDFATFAIPGIAIFMVVLPLVFMFAIRVARRRTPRISSRSNENDRPGLLLPSFVILGLSLGVYWLVTNVKGGNGIAYILFLLLLLLIGGWIAVNRHPPSN